MSKSLRQSVLQIANEAGIEIDDALIKLWDYGLNEINYPTDTLSGASLNHARKCLGVATKKELTSVSYWQDHLTLSQSELIELLDGWGIKMSNRTKTLPSGALRRLRSHAATKTLVKSKLVQEVVAPESKTVLIENKFTWRNVGKEREVRCLDLEEVLSIHYALCEDFLTHSDPIEPKGPRDHNMIESAIFRQHTSAANTRKYPTVEMTAAALLHSLVLNHPFYNGNKRTALVAMLVLLDENGTMLTTNEDSLFKFILLVAQHRIVDRDQSGNFNSDAEVLAIAEWIRANSRSIELGERTLSYRKLKHILSHHDCEFFHSSNGCNVKITRKVKSSWLRSKVLSTNISYGNEGRDVSRKTINKVREELQLDEQNGIDSAAFYEDVPLIIDNFIVKYRKTLQRLAKV